MTQHRRSDDVRSNTGLVLSLDVFDTCISRSVLHPRHVFALHGRLSAVLDADRSRAWASVRQRSENVARDRRRDRQCTLFEIYVEVQRQLVLDASDRTRLMLEEMELERALCVAVEPVRLRACAHAEAGGVVVYSSDMYLPPSFLRDILHRNGFPPGKIFVSGYERASKETGDLFRDHCRRFGRWAVRHLGDNFRHDFLNAYRNHVRGEFDTTVSRARRQLPEPCRALARNPYPDDAGLAISLLLGNGLASRLAGASSADCYSAVRIAPVVVLWVLWLLSESSARGVKQILFAARDGQLPYKIARSLPRDRDSVALRYIHVSRRSLWTLLCDRLNPDQLQHLLRGLERDGAAARLATRLGIADSDVFMPLRRALDTEFAAVWPSDANRIAQLVAAFFESSPDARHELTRRREVFALYLAAQGVEGDASAIFADIGWLGNLRTQYGLATVRVPGEHPPELLGRYLGLKLANCGPLDDAFLFRNRDEPMCLRLDGCAPFFEQWLAADHGTALEYRRTRSGAAATLAIPAADYVRGIRQRHAIVVRSGKHLGAALRRGLKPTDESLRTWGQVLALDAFTRPTVDEARSLGSASIGGAMDAPDEAPLIVPLSVPRALLTAVSPRHAPSPTLWYYGSSALGAHGMLWPARLALTGQRIRGRIVRLVKRRLAGKGASHDSI